MYVSIRSVTESEVVISCYCMSGSSYPSIFAIFATNNNSEDFFKKNLSRYNIQNNFTLFYFIQSSFGVRYCNGDQCLLNEKHLFIVYHVMVYVGENKKFTFDWISGSRSRSRSMSRSDSIRFLIRPSLPPSP